MMGEVMQGSAPDRLTVDGWVDGDLALDACNRIYCANIHRPGGRYTIATWLTFGSESAAARIGEECQEGTDCCCSEPHLPLRRATLQVSEEVTR